MKITNIFSPNHSKGKRSVNSIKFIVIHYTGMQSERESTKRLYNLNSKVSSHYLINQRGKFLDWFKIGTLLGMQENLAGEDIEI